MAPRVELVVLPFPCIEGLSDGTESCNNILHDKLGLLFEAFDGRASRTPLARAQPGSLEKVLGTVRVVRPRIMTVIE